MAPEVSLPDDKLIAWLCVMQYQFAQDAESFHVPQSVQDALIERGWCSIGEEKNWKGQHDIGLTEKGAAIRDLHGPEWGLDTIPEETET